MTKAARQPKLTLRPISPEQALVAAMNTPLAGSKLAAKKKAKKKR